MARRTLSDGEIRTLQSRGCTAADWHAISVSEDFNPERIRNVHFSGEVRIGRLDGEVILPGGVTRPAGLYQSSIHNCTLGENVYISAVGRLANYEVHADVIIEHVDTLVVEGESAFGNNVVLAIVNEAGGRSLPIFDQLSAQLAYLLVFFRHRPAAVRRLERMIEQYAREKTSETGIIEAGTRIRNTAEIRNACIGAHARIEGAQQLVNGTIRSCAADPAAIGQGVIARDFIVQEGAQVTDGALLSSCFVGQAAQIGKQYSAEHSGFFANCEAFHGEGVALFAGPYTVTHHKSSLLIAGYYSFFNTGSGTNHSNHMYKLGPVHQGVMERGCKTGSFAYLLWPAHIGLFSVVLGKHYTNLDTAALPFSYIDEEEGRCVVTPAMNLFTVGTRRDSRKWPNRDKRQCDRKFDLIHFPLLNPYTMDKILQGIETLQELYASASPEQEYVKYKGASIKRLMAKMGVKYYEIAVKVYLGEVLLPRLEARMRTSTNFEELKNALAPETVRDSGWMDLSGMLTPRKEVDALCDAIEASEMEDITAVSEQLQAIYAAYPRYEWEWAVHLLEQRTETDFEHLTRDHLLRIIQDWEENTLKFQNMIRKDARKEFDASARIGYGLAGGDQARQADFEAVRGTAEENPFLRELEEESEQIRERAAKVLRQLEQLEPADS